MTAFPAPLADLARAEGLRLSTFDWRDLPDHEPLTGTAVIGAPDHLEAFERQFVNARIGTDGGVRTLMAKPGRESAETVLYFPGYHLHEEPEQA